MLKLKILYDICMKCACLENFQKKILSHKMCVEIVLTIFKVYKSVLLLLLKRQCLILLKNIYIFSVICRKCACFSKFSEKIPSAKMCVEMKTYTICCMHDMCVFENIQIKNLSPKMCVEIFLKIFKVSNSVLLLLLKRKCVILKKKYTICYMHEMCLF